MLFYPAILLRFFIAKFHYTLSGPVRVGPDPTRTKSAHIVGDELNSTTRTRHGPERTFFAAKLRWVRAGRRQSPCGSVRVRVMEFSFYPAVQNTDVVCLIQLTTVGEGAARHEVH